MKRMSDEKLSKAEYFIQQLNVVNAKRFAFLIVLFFSSGFSFFHLLYGEIYLKILMEIPTNLVVL